MNKTELIDALAARYEGNRKQAAHALESVLDTITREVAKGEKVAITGFGSFEKAVRNARWVRNPQTGERIKSKKKSVPKFSAGKELKDVISGAKKLPKLTAANMPRPPAGVRAAAAAVTGAATSTAKKAPARSATPAKKAALAKTAAAKKAPAKTAAKKAAPAKTAAAKKAPAKKAPAKTAAAKKATPAKKSAAKTTAAKKAPAKTAAKKTPAKKAPAKKTAKKS
ncbi:HU family DNA-binding protein [Nocardioides oleivorans]|uniref:HU family DNA-binding protein n=1 Tax=Nocardioides oleivorans TaxID=273676 RepID=A0A4Q2S1F6_9ACTN|nr:HU family DNA-binding protein [Nocardioides oleivorans]RYB95367.1 HU family DNA-binding protein [Nocardioides oleivorans]